MTPVIGISASTLVVVAMRGVHRFAVAGDYIRGIDWAGGLPFMLPNLTPDHAPAYLARLDGLILSGGLDVDPVFYGQDEDPELGKLDQIRDEFELALARGAREQGIPVLSICRGMQVMNIAAGGTLLQHVPRQVEGAIKHEQDAIRRDALSHYVDVVPGSRLHELAGSERVRVNTFHHQACDRVADGFEVTARAPDGVIEGIEDPEHPFCVCVQWHPERCGTNDLSRSLFRGLVEAARTVAKAGA